MTNDQMCSKHGSDILQTKEMVQELHDKLCGTVKHPKGFIATTEDDISMLKTFKASVIKVVVWFGTIVGSTTIVTILGVCIKNYLQTL